MLRAWHFQKDEQWWQSRSVLGPFSLAWLPDGQEQANAVAANRDSFSSLKLLSDRGAGSRSHCRNFLCALLQVLALGPGVGWSQVGMAQSQHSATDGTECSERDHLPKSSFPILC